VCAGGSSKPTRSWNKSSYTDAERVILAGAYQALLRYGPLPHPSAPLVIHRSALGSMRSRGGAGQRE